MSNDTVTKATETKLTKDKFQVLFEVIKDFGFDFRGEEYFVKR